MIAYPALAAAVEGRDLDALALASGVPTHIIIETIAGERVPSPQGIQLRLARALGADPADLFLVAPELEEALGSAPSRSITDAATLRMIDGPPAA